MATIRMRKGKNGRATYLVQIRMIGKPSVSKRSTAAQKLAILNRYRATLSAVLSFVVEEEWIESNPLHGRR